MTKIILKAICNRRSAFHVSSLAASTRERNVSFASLILTFSVFGFLWPHHGNTGNNRHHVDFHMQKDAEATAADWDHEEDGFYTPTRSPGWNDLNH
jgi:hypothetical protein